MTSRLAELITLSGIPQRSVSSEPVSSFSMLTGATVAIVPQQATKLLTWSNPSYNAWTVVREAAKLALASETRDHQMYHIHEDVRLFLSATCDWYAGNSNNKSAHGEEFKKAQQLPLGEWIITVRSILWGGYVHHSRGIWAIHG